MSDAVKEAYPHLTRKTAEIAQKPAGERIAYLQRDRFINHRKAEAILNELEQLYRAPENLRAQGRLLIGEPLMGKSTILDKFVRNHRATDNPDGETVNCPVISVQFPERVNEGIYPEILRRLNAEIPSSARAARIRNDCLQLLSAVNCKIIVIDEFHNVLCGNVRERTNGLASVKYLMNEFRRPIVAAGTSQCLSVVASCPQMLSRLAPMPLSRFRDDDGLLDLLVSFESLMPLRKPSMLDEGALPSKIYRLTQGITGYVSDLLNRAARIAIESGDERITEETIDQVGWLSGHNQDEILKLL